MIIINLNKNFLLEPLTLNTLDSAETLQKKVFKQIPKKEKDILRASLDKNKYQYCYEVNEIRKMEYYVLKDKNVVVGLIGIYEETEDDKGECWIGWFCIDERFRGFGLGRNILDFIIDYAKKKDYTYLKLYTHNSSEFRSAIDLYNIYGFISFNPKYKIAKDDLFFCLDLSDVFTINDLCLKRKYTDEIISIEYVNKEVFEINKLLIKNKNYLLNFSLKIIKYLNEIVCLIENMNRNKHVQFDSSDICFVRDEPIMGLNYPSIEILLNRIKALIYALKISSNFRSKVTEIEIPILNLLNEIEYHFIIYKHKQIVKIEGR